MSVHRAPPAASATGSQSQGTIPPGRPLRCAVVGAAGYSGAELVSILLDHPFAAVVSVFGSERRGTDGPARPLGELFPRLRGRCDLPVIPASVEAIIGSGAEAVFLATPHSASHDLAPALLDRGLIVLDLSAAFRLKDASAYSKHYGFEHQQADWLERAVYGLVELHRAEVRRAALIAVPGCYPTSVILALGPLVRAGALDLSRRPIVDSTSGVSGAGRTPSPRTHFCEVSLQPYEVFSHRHSPEIDAFCGTPVVFTPHLGAYERGILSTIHAELRPGWNTSRISEVFRSAYRDEQFIRLCPSGEWPSVSGVRTTNFCDLGWGCDREGGHLIVVSAIDNLIKGAAGQAVQCMNVRCGFPEHAGLLGGRSEAAGR